MYFKHGHGKNSGARVEYNAWRNAKQRCVDKNRRDYHRYGGRGIKMCEEWANNYLAFYEYIGPRPSPAHSLDRINNDGNYEPGNCRWATAKEQSRNSTRTKFSLDDCEQFYRMRLQGMTFMAISLEFDCSDATIFFGVKRILLERPWLKNLKTSGPSSCQTET